MVAVSYPLIFSIGSNISEVLVDYENGLIIITINRPRQLNAVNRAVSLAVAAAVDELDARSEPYWDGVAAGRLRAQRCTACGVLRHYSRLLCSSCYSDAVEWLELSSHGKIHSWTVAHHPYHPAFTAEVPYTLVLVDLDEGIRAVGRWHGETPVIRQVVSGEFVTREGGADLMIGTATTVTRSITALLLTVELGRARIFHPRFPNGYPTSIISMQIHAKISSTSQPIV